MVIKGLHQGVVLQPDGMVCSLTPEELGLSTGMQHGPYLLEDSMAEAFCDTIVLWCVVDSKFLTSSRAF